MHISLAENGQIAAVVERLRVTYSCVILIIGRYLTSRVCVSYRTDKIKVCLFATTLFDS